MTPSHIKPVWYFTPLLRDAPRGAPSFFDIKLWGVLVMFSAIVMLFLVPWLDKSPVKSYRYRSAGLGDAAGVCAVSFLWLAKIGAGPNFRSGQAIIGRLTSSAPRSSSRATVDQARQDQAGAGDG